jgi:hypothetical protein
MTVKICLEMQERCYKHLPQRMEELPPMTQESDPIGKSYPYNERGGAVLKVKLQPTPCNMQKIKDIFWVSQRNSIYVLSLNQVYALQRQFLDWEFAEVLVG